MFGVEEEDDSRVEGTPPVQVTPDTRVEGRDVPPVVGPDKVARVLGRVRMTVVVQVGVGPTVTGRPPVEDVRVVGTPVGVVTTHARQPSSSQGMGGEVEESIPTFSFESSVYSNDPTGEPVRHQSLRVLSEPRLLNLIFIL